MFEGSWRVSLLHAWVESNEFCWFHPPQHNLQDAVDFTYICYIRCSWLGGTSTRHWSPAALTCLASCGCKKLSQRRKLAVSGAWCSCRGSFKPEPAMPSFPAEDIRPWTIELSRTTCLYACEHGPGWCVARGAVLPCSSRTELRRTGAV